MTFHLGPMLPLIRGTRNFSAKAIEIEIKTCPEGSGTAVTEFLDECLVSDGKQSVIYISFGTEHWFVFYQLQMYDFIGLTRGILGHPLLIISRYFSTTLSPANILS
jgi:hypothetical protein